MPMGQRHAPKPPHSICSLTDSEGGGSTEDGVTPLQRLLDLHGEEKTRRDVMIGRRVGFYKMRGEIGSGTFSRVKLALHELTRGKLRNVKCVLMGMCLRAPSKKYHVDLTGAVNFSCSQTKLQ